MRIEAQRELLAAPDDVWELVSEPHHLSDWWPEYTTVRPDRRGFAEGARWEVARGGSPGFLRRPGGEGMIVVSAIEAPVRFGWHDLEQHFDAELRLAPAAGGYTLATLWVEGSVLRVLAEGLRPTPRQALARLHALCQTAATL